MPGVAFLVSHNRLFSISETRLSHPNKTCLVLYNTDTKLYDPASLKIKVPAAVKYQEYLQGSPVSETFCYTLPQVVRLSKYRYRDIFRRVPER